jgi:hypothetical protein
MRRVEMKGRRYGADLPDDFPWRMCSDDEARGGTPAAPARRRDASGGSQSRPPTRF